MSDEQKAQSQEAAAFIQQHGLAASPEMQAAAASVVSNCTKDVRVSITMDAKKTAKEIAKQLEPIIRGVIDSVKADIDAKRMMAARKVAEHAMTTVTVNVDPKALAEEINAIVAKYPYPPQ